MRLDCKWGLCAGASQLSVHIYHRVCAQLGSITLSQSATCQFPNETNILADLFQGARRIARVTLVEFALVIPLILAILIGALDLGFAAFANNTVSLGAREGARKGIACSNCDADIRQRVKDTTTGLNLQDANITISRHTDSGTHYVTVTVTYSYSPFTPYISHLLSGGTLTLTGKATMYDE